MRSVTRSEFSRLYEANHTLQEYLHSAAYRSSALRTQLEDIMKNMEAAIIANAK
jgi:hypothetical protein